MPPSYLILELALFPLMGFAAPMIFAITWPEKLPRLPGLPTGNPTQADKVAAARFGVTLPAVFYGLLLLSVVLWVTFSPFSLHQAGFHTDRWLSSVLRGGYIGLSWAGIWLWLWLILSAPHRLRRAVPGLGAPLAPQLAVWIAGAFCEELWRVMGIAGLLKQGYSPVFSVIAVSVAFALLFSVDGLERAALAGIEGLAFGVIFLWQRSFLAPFTAHLAVQAIFLWSLGEVSQEPQSGRRSWRKPTRCPLCGAQLNRLQIRLTEVFRCPICREQLSVSDAYRRAMRWAGTLAYIGLFIISIAFFYEQIPENFAMWLVWPVAWGAGTSGLILYQRLFPPQLQYGNPNFLTLDLNPPRPPKLDA